ncbi:bactericidal permeability-increasing protein-like [Clavelina lepadiformis]|uniref:bactericidal permeability-increasing protein-like n=1 Tax=Clavelina lepadiformis TaxID=159417 RepID=UPI004041A7E3
MKLFLLSVILCLLFTASTISGQNPGLQVRLTSSGINFAKQIALGLLEDIIRKLEFPEIREGDAVLSNLKVKSFTSGTTTVSTKSPNVFKIRMKGAGVSVAGNWRAKTKFLFITFRGSGTGKAYAEIDLEQTIILDRSSDKPLFTVGDCEARVIKFDSSVEGSNFLEDWLYNLILEFLEIGFRRDLKDAICPELKKVLEKQTKQISTDFKTDFPLVFGTNINLGLVSNPAVTSNSITLALRGRCFPKSMSSLSFPFNPPTVPAITTTSQMARISISPYVMNTLLYSLWKSNVLKKTFTQQQLTVALGSTLNANTLAPFFPTLAPYGNQPLQAEIRASQAPRAQFTTTGIQISGKFDIIAGPSSAPQAATISTNVDFTAQPRLTNGVISGSISNVVVVITNAGVLPDQVLNQINQLIKTFLSAQIVPAVNEVTGAGFELPSFYGYSFYGATITTKTNALEIGSNFRKTPPSTTTRTVTPYRPRPRPCERIRRPGQNNDGNFDDFRIQEVLQRIDGDDYLCEV